MWVETVIRERVKPPFMIRETVCFDGTGGYELWIRGRTSDGGSSEVLLCSGRFLEDLMDFCVGNVKVREILGD